jgi:YegS/Rv2252/BmrU family lipid kinase
MKTLAVVNPRSAAGRTATATGRIRRLLQPLGTSVELAFTTGPLDATHRTRQALRDGIERIVALGGDGTVNEVVNGFFEDGAPVNSHAELGVVEFGTGGDLRKTLGIPGNPQVAVARIASGSPRLIDVGRARFTATDGRPAERLFVNVASFGLSANTVHRVDGNQRFKRLAGGLAYALGGAAEVLAYTPPRVRMRIDAQPEEVVELVLCAVANARYFGGGLEIAPMANLEDGLLDIITIANAPRLELLATIPLVFQGRHLEKPFVRHVRARTITATLEDPAGQMFTETDGESAGRLAVTYDLLPQALTIRC